MPPPENKYAELEARYAIAVREQASRIWALKYSAALVDKSLKTTTVAQSLAASKARVGPRRGLKARLSKTFQPIWRRRTTILLASGGPLVVVAIFLVVCMLFLPQSINYAFADQKSCVKSPIILPSLFKTTNGGTFKLSRMPSVSIGHTPIFSYRLCAAPVRDPLSLTSYTNHQWLPVGSLHLGKSIKIVTPKYPAIATASLGGKAVAIEKPLQFKLSLSDATFNYAVVANGQTNLCSKQAANLSCSLIPLKLAYAASYQASVVRLFDGRSAGTVLTKTLQTITATAITQSSIGAGTVVYDTPQQITINTDKTITQLQAITLATKNADGTTTKVPITSSFKGQAITINISSPLARKTVFDLHIANLTASDASTLEQPYDLSFSTSGGPKVTGINIPSYGLNSGQTIIVGFDQSLGTNQDPTQFASLLVNGVKQPTNISLSGKQLIITPSTSFPVCGTVTVQLSASAQNAYGVSGDSAWSYASRAHCYTTYSIGTSVKGRPITAYQFGSGSSMVLYIAAMEGNEQNSAEQLQQWIPELDANPGKIPSYRTIVVIPQINPDGFAADTRVNADGIDLNRNFPANNWQTQVTEPLANTVWTNDGGPNPLSEPESQALANFYQAHRPRLTITMHSHGGIVEANDAGDSIALGAQYASLADYRAIPTSAIGNFFDYTTTGAFEDWANDKLGLAVLEVEIESPTATEYTRNLPALWAMAEASP